MSKSPVFIHTDFFSSEKPCFSVQKPILNTIGYIRLTSLIHHYDVEGVLGLGECEHRPLRWPCVLPLTRGTLQVRIRFVRQKSDPTLEQTNKLLDQNVLIFETTNFYKSKNEFS